MSQLVNNNILEKLKTRKLSYFRFKKLDHETMLITNDLGAFCYLTFQEFQDFLQWWEKLSEEKYKELQYKKFFKDTSYYYEDSKYEFWMKNGFLAFWPILHILVVTLRCNHKCQYCHAAVAPMTAKNMDMDIETAKKIVDTIFISTAPSVTIEFQWWEPLVNWDVIHYVIEYSRLKSKQLNKGVNYCLVTNMSLMTQEKLDYLLKHNVSISTSLDGDEETHNYNRTFTEGNSYDNVIHWIKKINERYQQENKIHGFLWEQKSMWALLTTTKKTLSRYKEVIDTYVENWIDGIFIRPLNPYGFAAADFDTLWYTTDEFLDFFKKSLDYIIEINKSGVLLREHFSSIFLWKIIRPQDPNYLDDRSPCWASIGQVAYNYDGKIYSCDEGRMLARMWVDDFQIGEVSEYPSKTYQDMMSCENTNTLVQSSTLDGMPGYNDSVYKTYMWVCPIHNYKTRGSVFPNYTMDSKKKIEYGILDYLFIKMKDPEIKKIFIQWVKEPDRQKSQCDYN